MSRKVINQNDLRRLMRERLQGSIKNEEKIESPLAKYDSSGTLSCIACGIEITSKVPWRHHILTRSHKENVNKKLKRKYNDPIPPTPTQVIPVNDAPVSKGDNQVANNSKRLKTEPLAASLIQAYSSSEEDDDDDDQPNGKVPDVASSSEEKTSSALPPDFFDSPATNAQQNTPVVEDKPSSDKQKAAASGSLPEGFFDDPMLDAKARNVEYKDPKEEEWEKFQKIIAEETTVSQNIIEEDAVESEMNKDIEQIDEQIWKWHKVTELLSKREEIMQKKPLTQSTESLENSSSSAAEEDDEDIDAFLDWRAKDLWKK